MWFAPQLNKSENIFEYLQQMNGLYAIPILAVVLVAMLSKRVPPMAAKFGLIAGFLIVGLGNGIFKNLASMGLDKLVRINSTGSDCQPQSLCHYAANRVATNRRFDWRFLLYGNRLRMAGDFDVRDWRSSSDRERMGSRRCKRCRHDAVAFFRDRRRVVDLRASSASMPTSRISVLRKARRSCRRRWRRNRWRKTGLRR